MPPDSRPYVNLALDGALFSVYARDGRTVASREVTLGDLIEREDDHGLLLWAIVTQLASLNQLISHLSQQSLERPDMATLMRESMGPAAAMVKEMLGDLSSPRSEVKHPEE